MTLSTSKRVAWRGPVFDERTAHFLARLAARVTPYIWPTQGSFRSATRYSADTHAGAGAADLSVAGLTRADEREVIAAAREMGGAAWVRAAVPGLWVRHIHLIMIPPAGRTRNDGDLSPGAWSQVRAYYAGRDGLASNGPDPHPRPHPIRTYEQWLSTTGAGAALPTRSDHPDWSTMATRAEIRAEVKAALEETLAEAASRDTRHGRNTGTSLWRIIRDAIKGGYWEIEQGKTSTDRNAARALRKIMGA